MGQRKIIFVYNPTAHGGKLVAETLSAINESYENIILHKIEPQNGGFRNLDEIAHSENPDYIIVSGGDGTINKYFNYAFSHGIENIPIGIIPSGTANDFAGTLGIPNQIKDAIFRIKNGTIHNTDIMSVESDGKLYYCINVFSSGYLTCVSHTTNDSLKKRLGRLAYFIHGTAEAVRPKKMSLTIETNDSLYQGKALLFLVLNGKTAGKMLFAEDADPSDGLLNIRIFRGNHIFKTLYSFIKILLSESYGNKDVLKLKCTSVTIKCIENKKTDLDGDIGPNYPITIKCLKGAIKVIY